MRSEYNDCQPVPEELARFANELDYTTADLQADPDLRKRIETEYKARTSRNPEQEQTEGEYMPNCPTCGERATYRDAMDTFWDSNAHRWK